MYTTDTKIIKNTNITTQQEEVYILLTAVSIIVIYLYVLLLYIFYRKNSIWKPNFKLMI